MSKSKVSITVKLFQWRDSPQFAVCKNVTHKASNFQKVQPLSTNGPQQVQYQPLAFHKFQQISVGAGIWFGPRGSEVQILSPRPFSFSEIQTSTHAPYLAILLHEFLIRPLQNPAPEQILLPADEGVHGRKELYS
jgi:hypothetical protein